MSNAKRRHRRRRRRERANRLLLARLCGHYRRWLMWSAGGFDGQEEFEVEPNPYGGGWRLLSPQVVPMSKMQEQIGLALPEFDIECSIDPKNAGRLLVTMREKPRYQITIRVSEVA